MSAFGSGSNKGQQSFIGWLVRRGNAAGQLLRKPAINDGSDSAGTSAFQAFVFAPTPWSASAVCTSSKVTATLTTSVKLTASPVAVSTVTASMPLWSFVSASPAYSPQDGTVNCPLPTHKNGDLLLLFVSGNGNGVVETPTVTSIGWNLLTVLNDGVTSSTGFVYYKIAGGFEQDFASSGWGISQTFQMLAYRGLTGTLDASAIRSSAGVASDTLASGTVTTTSAHDLIINAWFESSANGTAATTYNAPAGTNVRGSTLASITSNWVGGLLIVDEDDLAPGTSTVRTFSSNSALNPQANIQLAFTQLTSIGLFAEVGCSSSVSVNLSSGIPLTATALCIAGNKDIITDGGFNNPSAWSAFGQVNFSGGTCQFTSTLASGSSVGQNLTPEDNTAYLVTYTLSSFISGSYSVSFFGGTTNGVAGTVRTAAGTYSEVITSGVGNTNLTITASTTSAVAIIDNISAIRTTLLTNAVGGAAAALASTMVVSSTATPNLITAITLGCSASVASTGTINLTTATTPAALVATMVAVSTVTPSLNTSITLLLVATSVAAIPPPSITTGINLSLSALAVSTIAPALTASINLAASAASSSAVLTDVLTTGIPLAITALAVSTVTQTLTNGIKLTSSPVAVATITPTLTNGIKLVSAPVANSTITPVLSSGISLVSSPAVASTVTPNVTTGINLSTSVTALSTMTVNLAATAAALTATASCSANVIDGQELIVNGTFDTDVSGWSASVGGGYTGSGQSYTSVGGAARVQNGPTASWSALSQDFATTSGAFYKFKWTKVGGTNTTFTGNETHVGDGTVVSGALFVHANLVGAGTGIESSYVFQAISGTSNVSLNADGTNAPNYYVDYDNVSVKQTLALNTGVTLSATAVASSSVTNALTTSINLTSAPTVLSTITTNLYTPALLTVTALCSVSVTNSLTTSVKLASTVTASSTLIANLSAIGAAASVTATNNALMTTAGPNSTTINLAWTNPTPLTDISSVVITYAEVGNPSNSGTVATQSGNPATTSGTAYHTCTANTTYVYTVTINSGSSSVSTVSANTLSAPCLPAPTVGAATQLSNSSVSIAFNDNAYGESRYAVDMQVNGGTWVQVLDAKVSTTNNFSVIGANGADVMTLTGLTLTPASVYAFRIYAMANSIATGNTWQYGPSANATNTVTAWLGAALDAAAVGNTTVMANLNSGISLVSVPTAVSTITSSLSVQTRFASTPVAASSITASLSSGIPLGVTAIAVSAITTNFISGIVLASSPVAVSTVTSALVTNVVLSSAPTVVSTATVGLTTVPSGFNVIGLATSSSTATLSSAIKLNLTANSITALTANLNSAINLSASALSITTQTSSIVTAISLNGTLVASSSVVSANVSTGIALQSTENAVSTITASLATTAAVLADSAICISTLTANLSTTIALQGTLNVNSTIVTNITGSASSFTSAGTDAVVLTSALSTGIQLTASNAVLSSITAPLTAPGLGLGLNAIGVTTITTNLTNSIKLAATSVATSTITSSLTSSAVVLASAETAVSTITASLSVATQFAANPVAVSTGNATIVTAIKLGVSSNATSTLLANLTTVIKLNTSAIAISVTNANIIVPKTLALSIVIASNCTANISTGISLTAYASCVGLVSISVATGNYRLIDIPVEIIVRDDSQDMSVLVATADVKSPVNIPSTIITYTPDVQIIIKNN